MDAIQCLVEQKLIEEVSVDNAHVEEKTDETTRVVLECNCGHKETKGVAQHGAE